MIIPLELLACPNYEKPLLFDKGLLHDHHNCMHLEEGT